MFCGNGGSAAECQHMSAEYCATLDHKRPRLGMSSISLTTELLLSLPLGQMTLDIRIFFHDNYKLLGMKGIYCSVIQQAGTV